MYIKRGQDEGLGLWLGY